MVRASAMRAIVTDNRLNDPPPPPPPPTAPPSSSSSPPSPRLHQKNYCALSNTTRARRAGLFLLAGQGAFEWASGRFAAARVRGPLHTAAWIRDRKKGPQKFWRADVLPGTRVIFCSFARIFLQLYRMRMGALRILKMARGVALP
jgi:hypothetical protein